MDLSGELMGLVGRSILVICIRIGAYSTRKKEHRTLPDAWLVGVQIFRTPIYIYQILSKDEIIDQHRYLIVLIFQSDWRWALLPDRLQRVQLACEACGRSGLTSTKDGAEQAAQRTKHPQGFHETVRASVLTMFSPVIIEYTKKNKRYITRNMWSHQTQVGSKLVNQSCEGKTDSTKTEWRWWDRT